MCESVDPPGAYRVVLREIGIEPKVAIFTVRDLDGGPTNHSNRLGHLLAVAGRCRLSARGALNRGEEAVVDVDPDYAAALEALSGFDFAWLISWLGERGEEGETPRCGRCRCC